MRIFFHLIFKRWRTTDGAGLFDMIILMLGTSTCILRVFFSYYFYLFAENTRSSIRNKVNNMKQKSHDYLYGRTKGVQRKNSHIAMEWRDIDHTHTHTRNQITEIILFDICSDNARRSFHEFIWVWSTAHS